MQSLGVLWYFHCQYALRHFQFSFWRSFNISFNFHFYFSPSASNGYLSLVSAITTPSSEVAGVSLPDLVSPSLAELLPDLTNGHAKLTPTKPPPLIPKSSTSLTLASPSLPAIVEKLISWPPGGLQKPSSGSEKAKADLTISLRPPISFEKKERPPSLPIGPLTNGNVINKVNQSN